MTFYEQEMQNYKDKIFESPWPKEPTLQVVLCR